MPYDTDHSAFPSLYALNALHSLYYILHDNNPTRSVSPVKRFYFFLVRTGEEPKVKPLPDRDSPGNESSKITDKSFITKWPGLHVITERNKCSFIMVYILYLRISGRENRNDVRTADLLSAVHAHAHTNSLSLSLLLSII